MTDYSHEEAELPKPSSLVCRFISGPSDAVSVYQEEGTGFYSIIDSNADNAVLRARTRDTDDALLLAACLA